MKRSLILAFVVLVGLTFSASASADCTNAPIAHDDVYNISANSTVDIFHSVLDNNDTDADGDTLSAYISGAPSTGSFCGIAPNGVCYQPPSGFTGLVVIPYEVTDGCHTVGGDVLVFVQ